MTSEHVRLTSEQQTLLLTLYARAIDSHSKQPILGDQSAAETLARLDYPLDRVRTRRDTAAGVLCRTRRLDEWTTEFLATHPDAVVLNLGCGLDDRVARVDPPPGVRWYDVDYPEVIALREKLYAPRRNQQMLGSSVVDFQWLESVPTDRPTMVTAEGLLMYLAEDQVEGLVRRLAAHVDSGRLACDIELPWAARMAKYDPALRRTGAIHQWGIRELDHLADWVPSMRLLAGHSVTMLPGMEKVSPLYRGLYGLTNRIPALRDSMRVALYQF